MIETFGKTLYNVPLKDYTTYRLDGMIKMVVYPDSLDKLKDLLKYLKENDIKHMVIGNGSNLIFKGDYDGVIIKLDGFKNLEIRDNIIKVGAGYSLMKLAIKTANLGLTGLEFAAGIPATIGGAVYMNAGAYKEDMSLVVSEIMVLDEDLKIKVLRNKDLDFSYRHSLLQKSNFICLEATLKLDFGEKEKSLDLINDRKKRRLESQPLEFPSAGSVFRNPEGEFAGKLIEDLDLKGTRVGDAMISEKHANFIINTGKAKGSDIIKLINIVQDKVKDKYGIELKVEQEFIE